MLMKEPPSVHALWQNIKMELMVKNQLRISRRKNVEKTSVPLVGAFFTCLAVLVLGQEFIIQCSINNDDVKAPLDAILIRMPDGQSVNLI